MTLCGPNAYCPANKLSAINCTAGTFTPSYNASLVTDCIACLPGFYCQSDSNKAIVISPCKEGYYCKSGASSENGTGICPAGYYCPTRTSNPRPCPPGKVCSKDGLSSPDKVCDAGSYCLKASKLTSPLDGI